ncbi:MAG: UvrB/UvrC motif-containing protein [Planctomycetes bacterium]|nr:UvrB/UvrC motif-containing protein [Planctomycetota bacterium]
MSNLCQVCNKRFSTVHVTEIRGDEKFELHVCDYCAQKEGIITAAPAPTTAPPIAKKPDKGGSTPKKAKILSGKEPPSIENLLEGISGEHPYAELPCPKCGMTFEQFNKRGRLGCAHDYDHFQIQLEPILHRIHQHIEHVGKVPKRIEPNIAIDRELRGLRKDLDEAIKGERFEEAAQLRDKIKGLEQDRDKTKLPADAGSEEKA